MKVRVRLYGTLSRRFPGYRHSEGMEVEFPHGMTVEAFLTLLVISESERALVTAEGRTLKADDKIRCGVPVNVLQAIHGGGRRTACNFSIDRGNPAQKY